MQLLNMLDKRLQMTVASDRQIASNGPRPKNRRRV